MKALLDVVIQSVDLFEINDEFASYVVDEGFEDLG